MSMNADERWIGRGEALTRLGVKAQTLYAYVSRGRIAARPDPDDPRRSLYAAEDVARLCDGDGTDRRPMTGAAIRGVADMTSSVSLIVDDRLFYRGLDAVQMAEHATVEDAARRLWDCRGANCFADLRPRIDPIVGGSTQRRIMAVLGRRMVEDRSIRAHDPVSLKREAASLLNEVIDSVSGPGPRLYFHQRLARGFKIADRDSHLIRRALVLGAEGGLNDAMLATRAAAAGGAPLAAAALAGLATLGGSVLTPLDEVVAYVGEARRDPEGAARRWTALRGSPPGFGGWRLARNDPRAAALLETADLPDELGAVRVLGETIGGRTADFGLALALVARKLELGPTGAGDLLMLGRLTGLIAHAIDQATDGSPIRARLRYVGPEPGTH
jgi:citrate synthase